MVAQGASIVNLIIAVIGGMSCIFSVFYILFGIKKDMTAATMTFILAIFLLVRNACLAFLQLTQGQNFGTVYLCGMIKNSYIRIYSITNRFGKLHKCVL